MKRKEKKRTTIKVIKHPPYSLKVVLPKKYCTQLNIMQGSSLMVTLDDKKLILQKI